MKISLEWLQARDACRDQVEIFAREWPKGVVVSLKVLKRAAELQLDIDWFAGRVLRTPLYADYQAKRATLDADYHAKCAPLDADYRAKRAPLDADYRAKRVQPYADYEAKVALLDADLEAKIAMLLWEALKDVKEDAAVKP